jgi:hypothetical protein
MRFVSFVRSGRSSWGILAGSEIIDLGSALGARAPTLRSALALDDFSGAARSAMQTAPRHSRADISLEPVIPDDWAAGPLYSEPGGNGARCRVRLLQ